MKKSYIADNIMREYEKKKRYEIKQNKKDLEKFILEKCSKCKNKDTKLCHIIKNTDNKFDCPFKNF